MFGYATNETPTLMPTAISLAHQLSERLAQVRKQGLVDFLRPDGKTQVTIGYDGHVAKTIDAVVVSTQHNAAVTQADVRAAVRELVIAPVLASSDLDVTAKEFFINPTGTFVVGGPMGDAGLTGRKIIVDTYGGASRHGGGAFSGKDPSKVDRSAAYAMRWVAKNVVAAGLASRAEVQVAYAIGKAQPVGLYVETFGTNTVDEAAIAKAIREVFDLRPKAIIDALDLLRPIYSKTATYGHFGRELPEFTWERTDRVADLQRALGL
jgi:S-adenosylmethionine synthetase